MFVLRKYSFKEIILLFSENAEKNPSVKTCIIIYFILCCSFELIHQRILKICMLVFSQILSSTAVFNIDNMKCFLALYHNILGWFLKDCGVMAAEKMNLKYIKLENNLKFSKKSISICITDLKVLNGSAHIIRDVNTECEKPQDVTVSDK